MNTTHHDFDNFHILELSCQLDCVMVKKYGTIVPIISAHDQDVIEF